LREREREEEEDEEERGERRWILKVTLKRRQSSTPISYWMLLLAWNHSV
jgi:hypothetical protein